MLSSLPFGMEVIADSSRSTTSRVNLLSLHCLSAWRSLLTFPDGINDIYNALPSSLPFGMEVIADTHEFVLPTLRDNMSSLPFGMEVIADANMKPMTDLDHAGLHCLSAWRSLLTRINLSSLRVSHSLHCLSAWRSLLTLLFAVSKLLRGLVFIAFRHGGHC